MGNCCGIAGSLAQNDNKPKKGRKKQNPFSIDYGLHHGGGDGAGKPLKLIVLSDPTGRKIESKYTLGRELGRGEFGVTYLCTDKETEEVFACKSILKKKLRRAVDIEDVRREVEMLF